MILKTNSSLFLKQPQQYTPQLGVISSLRNDHRCRCFFDYFSVERKEIRFSLSSSSSRYAHLSRRNLCLLFHFRFTHGSQLLWPNFNLLNQNPILKYHVDFLILLLPDVLHNTWKSLSFSSLLVHSGISYVTLSS